jgi:hypothetical protein
MTVTIQLRGDTAAAWSGVNPVLADREFAFETDTLRFKLGNGVLAWNALPYRADPTGNLLAVALTDNTPSAPAEGTLLLHSQKIGGRSLPHAREATGFDAPLQAHLARQRVGIWSPGGSATTQPGSTGMAAITAAGTVTARAIVLTNPFTRMRRLGFVSAAAIGSLCGSRVAAGQIVLGDGNLGGFFKTCRFGFSDVSVPTDARSFIGIGSSGAPTNVEPATLLNSIGVGHGAADTNLRLFYGGTVAQPPIDLGPNFPSNTSNVDVYDLTLFSPAAPAGRVFWEVSRVNTGAKASGVLNDASGIILPATNLLVAPMQAWRTNNATALAVGLDIMTDYLETDF